MRLCLLCYKLLKIILHFFIRDSHVNHFKDCLLFIFTESIHHRNFFHQCRVLRIHFFKKFISPKKFSQVNTKSFSNTNNNRKRSVCFYSGQCSQSIRKSAYPVSRRSLAYLSGRQITRHSTNCKI
jgi:hypothetical protein